MVKPKEIHSRRACPNCGKAMFYRKSLSTFLTGLYRGMCATCGYKDPERVKIFREEDAL